MNRYQEALDFIVKNSCPQKVTCGECEMNKVCNSEAKQRIDVLQELVDKATPIDPIPLFIPLPYIPYRCPNCNKLVNDKKKIFNYCPNCGQAISWRTNND